MILAGRFREARRGMVITKGRKTTAPPPHRAAPAASKNTVKRGLTPDPLDANYWHRGQWSSATSRREKLGLPFTHWNLRKLAAWLAGNPARPVRIGRERLRQILHEQGISFQRTRTWKESRDPDKDAKLDRIEHVTSKFPDRSNRSRVRPLRAIWPARTSPAEASRPDISAQPN
jgi:hypothetical protein